ncbi:MAG: hypothetical protein ACRDNE_15955 [Gaiellaceae bacterium]
MYPVADPVWTRGVLQPLAEELGVPMPPQVPRRPEFCYVATHCDLRKGFMDVLETWSGIDASTSRSTSPASYARRGTGCSRCTTTAASSTMGGSTRRRRPTGA